MQFKQLNQTNTIFERYFDESEYVSKRMEIEKSASALFSRNVIYFFSVPDTDSPIPASLSEES